MINKNTDKRIEINGKLLEEFKVKEEIADKLVKDYGLDVINIIKDKPYVLSHYLIDLEVIKEFIKKKSDNKDEGYKNREIVAATILHAVEAVTKFCGHTYIYKNELEYKITELGSKITGQLLTEAVDYLKVEGEIVIDKNNEGRECIYLSRLYKAEIELVGIIGDFVEENKNYNYNLKEINQFVDGYGSTEFSLNQLQKEAVKMALTNKITCLTGVAGSGKTTALKAIVEGFKQLKCKNILMCSFTGKAVERMASITGIQGTTIHRLLGIREGIRDKANSIKADVLIVDEVGIIGLELLTILFSSIKDNKNIKIVIVGHELQLPSIKPGSVLKELLKFEKIPTVRLNAVVRQEKGLIIHNSNNIAEGIGMNGKKSGVWLKKNEFEFIDTNSDGIKENVVRTIDKLLSEGISIYDIQVVSPVRKFANGVEELNMEIADRFNSSPDREINKFGILEKVIAIKNNYEKNIFNGQNGIVKRIEKNLNKIELLTVDFCGREVTFKNKEIEDFIEVAYVSSIFKMQGSESKIIIVVVDKEHKKMLNRELLYVAVTRGIERVIIVGDKEAFNEGVKRVSKERHSLLAERLIGISIAS